MIQFILMLLGLAFPNNNANTTTSDNNPAPVTVHASVELGEDTGGETLPILPPKK
ncbi:hypothetical protein [Chryseobacterium lactis]|uniref:hypothetical protein n=1 Tax=Chryseobacterium lactis TaxID=1241981 RepID=UPI0013DE6A27|nr:hypothetical protein [Chryseobacterium lactis]